MINLYAFVLDESNKCLSMFADICSGTSCPSNTLYYVMKCGDVCLPDDCNNCKSKKGKLAVSEACFSCLESSTAAKCQSCKPGDGCLSPDRVRRCRICAWNIYFGMYRCSRLSSPRDINNCILGRVYNHCRPCVCWAVCLFGMTGSCSCCRYGRC